MGLDRTCIEKALNDLASLRAFLAEQLPLDATQLEQDLLLRLAVLHALQLAIQIVLDVGAHLLASQPGGPVEEYADIGPRLAAAGIVPMELGRILAPMARFRNLVVHQYAAVDLARVAEIVRTHLADFEAYQHAVVAHLDHLGAIPD